LHLGARARRTATLLTRNPRLFCQVMARKLGTIRRVPATSSRRFNGVLFECSSREASMYFGSYAPLVVDAMRRLLKPGDIFFDVGANVGYLSAIAAGLVGTGGQVHAFEPASEHFVRLARLAQLNPKHTVVANACAAGEADAAATIYVTYESGQSTLVDSYKRPEEIARSREVPVVRLDSYIEQAGIDDVALIKIDVEGYELPVLKGLERYFRTGRRPAIICEVAPRAYPLLGNTISDLSQYISSLGYSAFDVADGTTPIDLSSIDCVDDVLFLARRT
jgi:FkbM family methyltransferase